jgi:hypothetical protein
MVGAGTIERIINLKGTGRAGGTLGNGLRMVIMTGPLTAGSCVFTTNLKALADAGSFMITGKTTANVAWAAAVGTVITVTGNANDLINLIAIGY